MNGTTLQVNIKGVYLIEKAPGPVPIVLLEDDIKTDDADIYRII